MAGCNPPRSSSAPYYDSRGQNRVIETELQEGIWAQTFVEPGMHDAIGAGPAVRLISPDWDGVSSNVFNTSRVRCKSQIGRCE